MELILAIPVIAALLIFWMKVVIPKVEAHDRRKLIEHSMRQEIIDAETERQVAKKLLKEAGYEQ